ncbi:cytochrome c oxidase accessory protein CcoG [Azospirillum sp. RWY-5-1]|uniref:Cytochrome c oxidase accessory protein CcoG n=1 Tax=Azospirillum oleiclasticum TaxID=2735135 RepID=A0ABX2T6L3_9PROT|nr:cytochrome c oxidase accessory protein CcoG [Azospirillum oleiclasticum]NYZ12679.1 cytochrome c oxidase accessory protein CcoG [Azospirillum oleiclasticum]NYZ19839.1 cytochrome c oxidase accessory protein CcoG [Azospirillum oleiclasticum]
MTVSSFESAAADVSPRKTSLYAEHKKIYPKGVKGPFRRLKWAALIALLAIYYITPWLRWDRGFGAPDQAVLVDMPGRRLYFFFIELWPQQVYYLTGVLILSAVGLFLATALAGRVWCGYACPQTVWSDLFLWVERLIEGDRGDRIRLDKAPWSAGKLGKKATKHGAWLLISALTGGAWILYFNDAPTLVREMVNLEVSSNVLMFIGLFTGTTYLLAGFAREQVCIYMCPWPRFQAAMQDEESLIVTYEDWRGEGRAHLKRSQSRDERQAQGHGDCIDCAACVHVCPTGVDIRKGPQLACIGCGLCVDACNEVMGKIGFPADLVRFDTLNAQVARAKGEKPVFRLVRPRTIIYTLMLLVVGGLMTAGLVFKPRVDVSILRDRAPLFVTLANGDVQNAYTVKILNMTRVARSYRVTVAGVPGAALALAGEGGGPAVELIVGADADSVATHRILVRAPAHAVSQPSTPTTFTVTPVPEGDSVRYDTVFMAP